MSKTSEYTFKNINGYLDKLADCDFGDVSMDAILLAENIGLIHVYVIELEEKLNGNRG